MNIDEEPILNNDETLDNEKAIKLIINL